jgi:serine/threonine protein kinase
MSNEFQPATVTMSLAAVTKVGELTLVELLHRGVASQLFTAAAANGQPALLSVLSKKYAEDGSRVARFDGEMAALARIQHENVASAETPVDIEGARIAVMQPTQGARLREALTSGPLPEFRVAGIAAQLARGLAALHEAGIVVRGLSLDGVLRVGSAGGLDRVAIFDLGRARIEGVDAAVTRKADGELKGDPRPLAPELLLGENGSAASDLWSLGVILYELITGRPPYPGGTTAEVRAAIAAGPLASPSALGFSCSLALEEIILGCLAPEANKRPSSLENLAATFTDLLEESGPISQEETGTAAFGGGRTGLSDLPETSGPNPLAPASYPRRFGPYQLLAPLGRGGMGDVVLARSLGPAGIERLCVLKQLRLDLASNKDYARRFLDEARTTVQLNHANVCHVLDVGIVGETPYIAMEHIHGLTLRRLMFGATDEDDRLPLPIALHAVGEILEGLDYAHRHRDPVTGAEVPVVHRDVSPHNVMVNYEGEVKLIDFGLATSELNKEETNSDVVLGKVAYMSPEQARGEHVDRRTDQYAAAIIATELLTGVRFYGERPSHTIWGLCSSGTFRPSRFTEISEEVRAVIDKALSPNSADRYPDCRTFRAALRDAAWGDAPPDGRNVLRDYMQEAFAGERERSWEEFAAATRAAPNRMTESVEHLSLDDETPWTSRSYSMSRSGARQRKLRSYAALGVGAAAVAGALVLGVFLSGDDEREPEFIAAPPSEKVEISFVTEPAGVTVLRGAEKKPVGITPLTWAFDQSDAAETFHFEREGHVTATKEVQLNREQTVRVVLAAVPGAAPPATSDPPAASAAPTGKTPKKPRKRARSRRSKPKKGADKNAVVDPW